VTAPKSPKETWNAIVDFADSADADAVAEMSEAEVDAELRKEGFDVAAETRKGQAEHDAAIAAARARAPTPKPKRWGGIAVTIAAASALIAGGAEVLYVILNGSDVLVGEKPDAGRVQAADAAGIDGDRGDR
jgi:hypothetical protein